jgi:hypothetical protein
MFNGPFRGGLAELRVREHGAIVGKAEEPAVERGVPEGGEQQPVINVEALRVRAIGPWYDVRGAKQLRVTTSYGLKLCIFCR